MPPSEKTAPRGPVYANSSSMTPGNCKPVAFLHIPSAVSQKELIKLRLPTETSQTYKGISKQINGICQAGFFFQKKYPKQHQLTCIMDAYSNSG